MLSQFEKFVIFVMLLLIMIPICLLVWLTALPFMENRDLRLDSNFKGISKILTQHEIRLKIMEQNINETYKLPTTK